LLLLASLHARVGVEQAQVGDEMLLVVAVRYVSLGATSEMGGSERWRLHMPL
jgi:hypothetical protein